MVKKISSSDKTDLDKPLTLEELYKAVLSLQKNKSPGPDGITAEFYQSFWYLIQEKFLQYINCAKNNGFKTYRNTSSTTLVYKRKGEIFKLNYYRPIALINVDLKILTKTLSNRLRPILTTIIHHSQTAVDGRKIDYTVHLIRDLIDLVNKDNTEAALIFIDQEKAFDRVEHDFLFKTMQAFGIGDGFIQWLRVLYSNATTKIKVNGYFTDLILLTRGLRQGCPLSPSLYVLVMEIFSLQLRANPNIVGFTVAGERIVSMHYADDATIVIKQNQCFKEVVKEIQDYEEASGAKVNYEKTKGLWLGSWKNRDDAPLGITWTRGNVKNLGVYFGNEDPAGSTFADILPKVRKSMNYWKQFKLCKFSKARVIEIFHASRLWYGANFYPLPIDIRKDLQRSFKDYVNFPRQSNPTVSESEMKKLRLDGGVKLIDIQAKVESARAMWLMDLANNCDLKAHAAIMTAIVGEQKGGLTGVDLIFATASYCTKLLRLPSSKFYTESFKSISKLSLSKKVTDLYTEKFFYNPLFTDENNRTLPITRRCERDRVFNYGEIADEFSKQFFNLPHRNYVANVFNKIKKFNVYGRAENTIFVSSLNARVAFGVVTQKNVYEELLRIQYVEHHSVQKWEANFNYEVDWEKVWISLNNPVTTERVKTTIWEQIHLNDYCTYSYNKWHNVQDPCPLCLSVPISKFHLTLNCEFTKKMWDDLEPRLIQILNSPVTNHEKVFGLLGHTPSIILRNFLTYLLRQCIVEQEGIAYHNKRGMLNIRDAKARFNSTVKSEVMAKYRIYAHIGRNDFFEKIFAQNEFLLAWENNWWQILTLYNI